MKKFFTVVPLQSRENLKCTFYKAVDNQKLQLHDKVSFPILCAIGGYVAQGETFRLIQVVPEHENAKQNTEILKQELQTLCKKRELTAEITSISVPYDEHVSTHIETFQKLIDFVEDNDELFTCITYGTKPLSEVLRMATQYAYRLHKNTSIGCVVYGEYAHHTHSEEHTAKIYDQTALIQLDEIVRMLAEHGIVQPKQFLNDMICM